jgi:hypothetical protein
VLILSRENEREFIEKKKKLYENIIEIESSDKLKEKGLFTSILGDVPFIDNEEL